jgi:hypothetical protein
MKDASGVAIDGRSSPVRSLGRAARVLVLSAGALFVISTAFPALAAVTPAPPPRWIGVVDVAVAFATILSTVVIVLVTRGVVSIEARLRSYRVYRVLATVPLGLLLLFLIAGDRIHWQVLLPGLAWRTWLFIYATPAALTVWASMEQSRQATPVGSDVG